MHVVQEQKQTLFLLADDVSQSFLALSFFIATRGRQGDKGVRGSVCDVAQMLDLS